MPNVILLISSLVVSLVTQPLEPHSIKPGDKGADGALKNNIKAHVVKLSSDIGDRSMTMYDSLEKAKIYIVGIFKSYGYDVTLQTYTISGDEASNIIAVKKGTKKPDDIVLLGAHYDSCGNPGADDNASGVAGLLETARLLKDVKTVRTIKFVAFVNEEPPYFQTKRMGSRVYTQKARESKEEIVSAIIMDGIGYYTDRKGSQKFPPLYDMIYPDTGNFIGVLSSFRSGGHVGRVKRLFRKYSDFPIEAGVAPASIQGVDFSDHWSFWQEGYPAVMVTDTLFMRNKHYHDDSDTWETLNYDNMARVVSGLALVLRDIANS